MAGEDELVLGPVTAQQVPQRLRLPLQDEFGGLEQAVVHVAAVEHLHPELVVHEHLVVGVAHEVEAAHGEDDLLVRLVDVDEVRRARVADLLVGSPLEDALGVDVEVAVLRRRELGAGELLVVVREHGAAEARDGLELVGGRRRPRLAVVGADVGEPLPRPPRAAKAHHPLEPATHRHGRSPRPACARLPRDLGFWCGGGCLRSAPGLFSAVGSRPLLCGLPVAGSVPSASGGRCGSGLGVGRIV